jgi:hypothetical protein
MVELDRGQRAGVVKQYATELIAPHNMDIKYNINTTSRSNLQRTILYHAAILRPVKTIQPST